MAGTVKTDLAAITLTANAKAVVSAKGADVGALQSQAIRVAGELQVLLKAIIAAHPSGGGDAANLTALNTILAELV